MSPYIPRVGVTLLGVSVSSLQKLMGWTRPLFFAAVRSGGRSRQCERRRPRGDESNLLSAEGLQKLGRLGRTISRCPQKRCRSRKRVRAPPSRPPASATASYDCGRAMPKAPCRRQLTPYVNTSRFRDQPKMRHMSSPAPAPRLVNP
jgi:hypothetical protein